MDARLYVRNATDDKKQDEERRFQDPDVRLQSEKSPAPPTTYTAVQYLPLHPAPSPEVGFGHLKVRSSGFLQPSRRQVYLGAKKLPSLPPDVDKGEAPQQWLFWGGVAREDFPTVPQLVGGAI